MITAARELGCFPGRIGAILGSMNDIANILEEAILRAVERSPLAERIRGVQVEPARDEDDEEFLRIALLVHLPDRDIDEELEALLERIEETVAAMDDRYASVRFLDAA